MESQLWLFNTMFGMTPLFVMQIQGVFLQFGKKSQYPETNHWP